jgi:hypothetical protein
MKNDRKYDNAGFVTLSDFKKLNIDLRKTE